VSKTKLQKKDIIQDITDKIGQAKSLVFVKFDKLGVIENEELRNELRKEGGEYLATKKTLLDISLKNNELEGIDAKSFEGQVATVFGYQDEVAPSKIVAKFVKSTEGKIEFLGGVLENKFIAQAEVTALSKLPSKQELYARLVGSINAPVSGFVNALAGNLRGLVGVLKAIQEKKS